MSRQSATWRRYRGFAGKFSVGLLSTALLAPLAAPADAQSVRVTSGEHGAFTRIVLQSRDPIDWTLDPEGLVRAIRLKDGAPQFDPAALFRVIPRSRLSDLRVTPDGLEMVLACACEIRTDQPRPGVVVFDIHDGDESLTRRQRPPSAPRVMSPPAPPPLPRFSTDIARSVGGDLARRMRETASQLESEAAAEAEAALAPLIESLAEGLVAQLSQQMSHAVAQGMLTVDPDAHPEIMAAPQPSLPGPDLSNMRITLAADGPISGNIPPATERIERCPPGDLLDFATADTTVPFRDRKAQLMRALYGEFDVPDAAGHEALARLYLEHGFGAEARLMLENTPAQIQGRDLLLGLSDILEDRYSNARLRLAERIDCEGATSLYAALAGAPPAGTRRQARQIARAFADLPIPMRRNLGEPLVHRLIEVEAIDAARVVADTLRRLPGQAPAAMTLVDAALDAARGDLDSAAARLDAERRDDGPALVMRLTLALERGEHIDSALLADAEVLATSERTTVTGRELMSLLVQLENAADNPDGAFVLLDRLERWLTPTPSNAAQLGGLRDASWATLTALPDDRAFLQTFFDRADWQSRDLSPDTRVALAARLVNFGLTDPALRLLSTLPEQTARHLRARIQLLLGDAQAALDILAGLGDDAAEALRAQARRVLDAAAPVPDDAEPPPPALSPQTLAPSEGIMRRGTALLTESAQLRDSLTDLLRPAP